MPRPEAAANRRCGEGCRRWSDRGNTRACPAAELRVPQSGAQGDLRQGVTRGRPEVGSSHSGGGGGGGGGAGRSHSSRGAAGSAGTSIDDTAIVTSPIRMSAATTVAPKVNAMTCGSPQVPCGPPSIADRPECPRRAARESPMTTSVVAHRATAPRDPTRCRRGAARRRARAACECRSALTLVRASYSRATRGGSCLGHARAQALAPPLAGRRDQGLGCEDAFGGERVQPASVSGGLGSENGAYVAADPLMLPIVCRSRRCWRAASAKASKYFCSEAPLDPY